MDRSVKVLIVDREPKRLLETSRILQPAGYEILGAASGEECLRIAKGKRPDLILLDTALPDVSGIDLAKQIKKDPTLASTYVALLSTGETPSAIQARGLESGADAYMVRTISSREFLARVEAMLRRKRAEEELRASLQQWQAAFDAISDPIYVVNLENKIVHCNLALAKFLGQPPSGIIGHPCYELVHGTSEPIPACLVKRMRETRHREALAVQMQDLWLQVTVDPLLDENGNLIGGVHILSDITERQRTEEELKQARIKEEKRAGEFEALLAKAEAALQAEAARREQLEGELEQARAAWERQAQELQEALAKAQKALQAEAAAREQAQAVLGSERTAWEKQVEEQRAARLLAEEALCTESTKRLQVEEELAQARAAWEKQAQEQQEALAKAQQALQAESARRKQVEEELAQARAAWEKQAQEKQEALAKAEQALQAEAAQRQRAEEELAQAHAQWERQAEELRAALARVQDSWQAEFTQRQQLEGELKQAQAQLEKQHAALAQAQQAQEKQQEALAKAEQALQAESARRKQVEEELAQARAQWEKQVQELSAARALAEEALRTEAVQRLQVKEELEQARAAWEKQAQEQQEALAKAQQALQAEAARRKQVEEELAQARAAWEKQAQEQQEALAKAQQALQAEAARREQVEEELAQVRAQWEKQVQELQKALAKAEEALRFEAVRRLRVEEALHRSEERLHAVAGSAADLVYEWDVDSGQMEFFADLHGRLYANRKQFPRDLQEFQQVIHPEDRPKVQAALQRHLQAGEPWAEEFRVLRYDGQTSYWLASGTVLMDKKGKRRLIGTARDITARKHAEEEQAKVTAQLHQAEKMEALGLLAEGVAQEFGELLTAILGNVELGLAQLHPSYPLYRQLTAVQKAAKRAVALTRQLLALGRRQALQLGAVDLNQLIRSLPNALRSLLGECIDLELSLAPELPPVLGDATALEQVLMNLAQNARDAMPQGGTLHIETAPAMLDEAYCRSHPQATAGQYVRLSVADTRAGFAQALQEHLFEPFYLDKEAGMEGGLALSVVYGIVKQHGGFIEVHSEDGGTKFEIHLPAYQASEKATPLASSAGKG